MIRYKLMAYTIPKGVFDILPKDPDPAGNWRESFRWQFVQQAITQISSEYGYQEIRTPIFEKYELFTRSVGQTSDIVNKEMFTFHDKANRHMALRPEGTAPVMRAFIEKKLFNQNTQHKLFYVGPMFRYERQQAGRYRQHHQFGLEAIGEDSPYQDAEVIDLLYSLYSRLGLTNLTIYLNSIGDEECRKKYRKALINHLKPFENDLSEDSRQRLQTNPLRILDSKDSKDKKILSEAPSILDFLEPDSREHFEQLQAILNSLNLPFIIHPRLVRGLDYYNRTVFEITSGDLGAQNTIGAGGRYDSLIELLGGPKLPAVGFGTGLERIIQTMLAQNASFPTETGPHVFIIPIGGIAFTEGYKLLKTLRTAHIQSEMAFSDKKLKAHMKYADKIKAKYVIILGDEELNKKAVELKNMEMRISQQLPLNELINFLKNNKK